MFQQEIGVIVALFILLSPKLLNQLDWSSIAPVNPLPKHPLSPAYAENARMAILFIGAAFLAQKAGADTIALILFAIGLTFVAGMMLEEYELELETRRSAQHY